MSRKTVFISYSADSPTHVQRVRGLAARLRADGIDVRIDTDVDLDPPEGWAGYSQRQIEEATYVLLICTEVYRRRFDGREEAGRGRGVTFEGRLIRQEIFDTQGRSRKYLPVLLDPDDEKHVPWVLRDCSRYVVSPEAGPTVALNYQSLVQRLRGEPPSTAAAPMAARQGISPTLQPPVDFVILTPLEEERDAMLSYLGDPKRLPPTHDDIRVYYPALLPVTFTDNSTGTYQLVVTEPIGMGHVDSANAVGDAIRRWRPKYIIVVGIAGGLAKAGVRMGDVLIADHVADYELQKLTPERNSTRWSVHKADPRLLTAAKQVRPKEWQTLVKVPRPEAGQPQRHIGPICTGNKVIAADGLMDQYRDVWTRLIGVEMEAGGAASAALQAPDAPGFFVVRGVSDLADADKDKPQTQSWRAYACDVAAAYVMAFLKSGPIPFGAPS